MDGEIHWRTKLAALFDAMRYRPKLATGVVLISVVAAVLEGIGLGFILPIIELARGSTDPETASGVLGLFADVYLALDVPFTMAYLVVGVAIIMSIRYTSSFLVGWLRGAMETYYTAHLQQRAFEQATVAKIAYFDQEGSDDILNAIVTQAEYAGRSLQTTLRIVEQGLLAVMYFGIALAFAPILTLAAGAVFAVLSVGFDRVLESGYEIGDRVADANERIQSAAQAGTQGIRDVKLFGLRPELIDVFEDAVTQFRTARVKSTRNKAAIRNFYQLLTAIMIFVLIYIGLQNPSLSLGSLGVFLFALFRLGPRVSTLNNLLYHLSVDLPHLVRTKRFLTKLERNREPMGGDKELPDSVGSIGFNEVSFSYNHDERVLKNISLHIDPGEFVAFVGPSGAGKSTIISLLARLYEPEEGNITASDIDISRFDVTKWRKQVAVVRQHPYIFNETLRRNITVGDRSATDAEVQRACELAQVTEFLEDLPNGYQTDLGDDGVRLSGGQRQRVALARALLTDADLLVLDEATSDLDTEIEHDIQQAIESMERERTLIVIAHRLSTVKNADRIFALEDGHIVEAGGHEELLKNDGTYARLYTQQGKA
ncbi:ABC transporter ATP-binding protein [Halorhabdus sp. BNX81]|uniref:ABC transporter ATP-binding protein n=1 Tax=Halorhabdus sp. BNX81 TaxID=2980181 RepID=UPI0023DD390E|nr:ABC transporter ATP-binding protein [Halorhabdus sp. BNX81]WEL20547.1 ABC-type multidrug transport system, ATPase and permease component [Halorhabdus sp. BNX81]